MTSPEEIVEVAEHALDTLIADLVDLHIRKAFASPALKCAVVALGTEKLERAHLEVLLGLAVARLADREAHS